MSELKDRIIGQIVADFYDKRIMSNLVRAHYVERMIAQCLGEGWNLVSADWSGWDLQNSEGVRAEVKQSAALQTWTDQPSLAGRPTRGRFDIAPRTGYWTASLEPSDLSLPAVLGRNGLSSRIVEAYNLSTK